MEGVLRRFGRVEGLGRFEGFRISRLKKSGSDWFVLSVVAVVQKSEYGRSDSRK